MCRPIYIDVFINGNLHMLSFYNNNNNNKNNNNNNNNNNNLNLTIFIVKKKEFKVIV